MKRRSILLAACAVLPLAACAGMTASQVANQAVTDLGLIANGFSAMIPELSTIPGISAATLTSIQGYFAQAQAAASSVSGTVTEGAAQTAVQQVETYLNEALMLLGTAPLPPQISTVLVAVRTLLPIVEATVGLVGTVGASPGSMTPAQARGVLAVA